MRDPQETNTGASENPRPAHTDLRRLRVRAQLTLIKHLGDDLAQIGVEAIGLVKKDPVLSAQSLRGFKKNDWVYVTGRIEFRTLPGRAAKSTYLLVARRENVKTTRPEPDPYIR